MYLATHRPGFGYRERLTRTRRRPKGKTNMSAKALAADNFELAAEQAVPTGHQASEALAAENQFREDLWRAYRIEAIHAGFSAFQAAEYATALSSAMGPASDLAPVGRGWFYQGRPAVAWRTVTSGLGRLARRDEPGLPGKRPPSALPV